MFRYVHIFDCICDLACLIVLSSASVRQRSGGAASAEEKCFLTIFCCKSILDEALEEGRELVTRFLNFTTVEDEPNLAESFKKEFKGATISGMIVLFFVFIYILLTHLLNPRNASDLARLAVMVMGLSAIYTWQDETQQRSVVATWAFERWWHAMSMLRGFEMFGPRILPIVSARDGDEDSAG